MNVWQDIQHLPLFDIFFSFDVSNLFINTSDFKVFFQITLQFQELWSNWWLSVKAKNKTDEKNPLL